MILTSDILTSKSNQYIFVQVVNPVQFQRTVCQTPLTNFWYTIVDAYTNTYSLSLGQPRNRMSLANRHQRRLKNAKIYQPSTHLYA